MQNNYYVYAHIANNEIFYIGKGVKARAFRIYGRNKHWNNIVLKYGFKVKFLKTNLTEKDAFRVEKLYITYSKNKGLCRANYSYGGDGCSGYRWSEEQRIRHSKKLKSQTPNMKMGQKARSEKLTGRSKLTHKGIRNQSKKIAGVNNGRAIWCYITPLGIFTTAKEAAKAHKITLCAVCQRIVRKSKGWTKVLKSDILNKKENL